MTRRAGGAASILSWGDSFDCAYVGTGAVVVDQMTGDLVCAFSNHAGFRHDRQADVGRHPPE
jgi:hypothetical protein